MADKFLAVLRSRFVALPLGLAVVVGAWNLYISRHDDGVVRGRVVGIDGRPIAGAKVRMMEKNFTTNTDRGSTVTGPDGSFAFSDNRSHSIQLRAEKEGVGRSRQEVVRLYFRAQHVVLETPLVIQPVKPGE